MRADLDRAIDDEIARVFAPGTAARTPAADARREPGVGPGPTVDAGSKLDALARRLEGRLNRPRSRAGAADSPTRGEPPGGDDSLPSPGWTR